MMKQICLAVMWLLITGSASWAQIKLGDANDPYNFYTIKKNQMAIFENQISEQGIAAVDFEGSPYREFLKWVKYWEPLLYPSGDFKKYFEREKIYEKQFMQVNDEVKANTNPWYELGPYSKPNCSLTSIGLGGLGIGPIRFTRVCTTNSNLMLCGSEGGLFVTTDGGANWTNANTDNGWTRSGCAWADIDPANSAAWFAGNDHWLGYVKGVWRTTNSGGSWERIGDNLELGGDYNIIKKIIVDPNNSGYVYVATVFGIFRTTNAYATPASAVTWTKVYPTSGNLPIYDLEIKPGSPDIIYATVGMNTSKPEAGYSVPYPPADIIVSTNNGANWNQVANIPVISDVDRITIETSDADVNRLWVLFVKTTGACDLYTYYSIGNVWTFKSSPSNASTYGGGHAFTVSNFDPNYVLLASGIYYQRSSNSGSSWTTISGSNTFHVDMEDFVSPPATCGSCLNDFWMCNHGGIYKSTDNGSTWTDKSNGLGVAQILGFSTSYLAPERIAVGLYHDGTDFSYGTYGNGWTPQWCTVYGGDGLRPLLDYSNVNVGYYSAQQSSYSRTDNYDDSNVPTVLSHADWDQFLVQNPITPTTVFGRGIGLSGKDIYRSLDRGMSKDYISDFTNAPYNLNTDHLPFRLYTAPSDENRLYIHLLNAPVANAHYIYTVDNAMDPNPANIRTNWVQCYTPLPNKWIGSIEVDTQNPRLIYVAYNGTDPGVNGLANGMVFKVDYSSSFATPTTTDITYNLPPSAACDLAMDKGSNGGLYAYTEFGVWFTDNSRLASQPANSKWIELGVDLPHLGGPSTGIEINYVANKIRVGTFARGVWEHDLYCSPNYDINYASMSHIPGLFAEAENNITSIATVTTGTSVDYRAGNTIRLQPGFIATAGCDFRAFIHGCNHPGNSFKEYAISQPLGESFEELAEFEDELKNSVILYPNPANGQLNISIREGEENQLEGLRIFDISGKLIKAVQYNTDASLKFSEIDITDLPNGFYLAEVKTAGGLVIIKFSKDSN